MGYLQACSLAWQVEEGFLDHATAMYIHLQSNHYPPVSAALIPACLAAVECVAYDSPDEVIELPRGEEVTAGWLVDRLHLEPFVGLAIDEEADPGPDEALQDDDGTPADEAANYSGQSLSYNDWMKEVDRAVQRITGGISTADLADFCSRDLYDSGATPDEAADEALANDDLAQIFLD